MHNLRVDYWFPTPIWLSDLTVDNEVLKTACINLRNDNLGRKVSNRGGWQSNDFYPEQGIKVFDEVITEVTKVLNEIFEVNYESGGRCVAVSQYWINVNKGENVNQTHIHPGAFLSAVYYVATSEDSGAIYFERNAQEIFALGCLKAAGNTIPSGIGCEYKPPAGRLLIFPGWVPHGVLPSKTDEERISIAFNAEIRTGTFGTFI
jgi:uncharacterized protein (TIGR02466 family)